MTISVFATFLIFRWIIMGWGALNGVRFFIDFILLGPFSEGVFNAHPNCKIIGTESILGENRVVLI